ncbi:MAG: cytochrome c biogenesis protein CcsA [Bryobacterales bacterium]|nr:cytochrome c biogenesis protein CcsA [Bryobacterales bacterium]
MRERVIIICSGVAAILLAWNLGRMFLFLGDEAQQGAIYRIMFFHVPAAWTSFTGFFTALVASILFLARKNFRNDALAVAATEVGLAFAAVNLVTGMLWGRIIWGIWWTWDWRLTSMLVCFLLYAGYLVLRRAVEEPTQRATLAGIFSIFAFADVPIVFFSIKWWRTQHPQPVVWGGGSIDPAMKSVLYWNFLAVLLIGLVLVLIRLRQEETQREIDALRRTAHAL